MDKAVETPVTPFLKNSFMTSYVVLMGYTGLTLIEALRTSSLNVRHVMNIETTVSLVAGLVYGIFYDTLKDAKTVDLHQITKIRYIDWSITTPLILLVLMLFYKGAESPSYKTYGQLILLNWAMLGSGFLGEEGIISRWAGFGLGFLFFGLMLLSFYGCCISPSANHAVFYIFAAIWTGYGIAYLMDEETKNIAYNGLDVISKAIFGVILYLFFGKVLKF
jgi:bacteriorhodopsin